MAVQHPLCAKTVAASALVLASGLGVFATSTDGYLSLDDRPRYFLELQPAPTRKILQKRCQERGLRVLAEQSFMRVITLFWSILIYFNFATCPPTVTTLRVFVCFCHVLGIPRVLDCEFEKGIGMCSCIPRHIDRSCQIGGFSGTKAQLAQRLQAFDKATQLLETNALEMQRLDDLR